MEYQPSALSPKATEVLPTMPDVDDTGAELSSQPSSNEIRAAGDDYTFGAQDVVAQLDTATVLYVEMIYVATVRYEEMMCVASSDVCSIEY